MPKRIRIFALVALALSTVYLASCDALRVQGAGFYDKTLDSSIQFTCNDTSIGSIKRRFGNSSELMNRWVKFCFGDNAPVEVPPDWDYLKDQINAK